MDVIVCKTHFFKDSCRESFNVYVVLGGYLITLLRTSTLLLLVEFSLNTKINPSLTLDGSSMFK